MSHDKHGQGSTGELDKVFDALTAAYVAYGHEQGLELESADETLASGADMNGKPITPQQREWLSAFYDLWDATECADTQAYRERHPRPDFNGEG